MDRSRRTVLASVATTTLLAALAGCSGGDSPAGTDTPTGNAASRTPTEPATTQPAGPTPTSPPDLDLREANVVAVALEPRDDGVRFSVTLHHDDAGEPGYANWWQVERLDGTRLGRRDLLHAHDRQPFTRSATIEVPAGVACVVVRGHDRTHGYGGRAMVVDVETGETRPIDQGADPRSADAPDCP